MKVYEVWGGLDDSAVDARYFPTKKEAIEFAEENGCTCVEEQIIISRYNRRNACDLLNNENYVIRSKVIWGENPALAHI